MPPLPAEALTLSGFGQMAPDLLFHPVSNVRETSTGVTYSKVPNPTSQNRIDLIDQSLQRSRSMATENRFELAKQSTLRIGGSTLRGRRNRIRYSCKNRFGAPSRG